MRALRGRVRPVRSTATDWCGCSEQARARNPAAGARKRMASESRACSHTSNRRLHRPLAPNDLSLEVDGRPDPHLPSSVSPWFDSQWRSAVRSRHRCAQIPGPRKGGFPRSRNTPDPPGCIPRKVVPPATIGSRPRGSASIGTEYSPTASRWRKRPTPLPEAH